MKLKKFLEFMEMDYMITSDNKFVIIDERTGNVLLNKLDSIFDIVNSLLDMYASHIVDMACESDYDDDHDSFLYLLNTDNEDLKEIAACLINPNLIVLDSAL